MSIAVVQSGQAGAGGGTWAVTLGAGTTAGNTLFYVATGYQTSGVTPAASAPLLGGSSVTGSAKLIDAADTATIKAYTSIWMLPNIPGGQTSCAITMTGSQSIANVGLGVYEVSGLGSSPSLDKSSSGNSGATPSTAVSSGATAATTHAAEFILGAATIDQSTAAGAAGYTSQSFGGNTNSWSGYQVAASTGTFTWSQTASVAANWSAAVVTVAAAAVAGSGLLMAAFP